MKISNNTAESIATFADNLRYSLNLNSEIYIPLDQEIEYLKNWIHIQKVITYPIHTSIKINGNSTNFNMYVVKLIWTLAKGVFLI